MNMANKHSTKLIKKNVLVVFIALLFWDVGSMVLGELNSLNGVYLLHAFSKAIHSGALQRSLYYLNIDCLAPRGRFLCHKPQNRDQDLEFFYLEFHQYLSYILVCSYLKKIT